ncbi:MAG: hypothetical protein QM727_08380 [Niabella sp.]
MEGLSEDPFDQMFPQNVQRQILNISKWARVISVIGFGVGAFVVLTMIFNGAEMIQGAMAAMPIQMDGLYGALVMVFFIFFFVAAGLLYFLYRASVLLRHGVEHKDTVLLGEGFGAIKRFFFILVIITIFGLSANFMALFQ